jgi:hypothetical protein
MDVGNFREGTLFPGILDAMPSLVFLMDREARILFANRAARRACDPAQSTALRRLGGEALHCMHAQRDRGCGTTDFCADCIIRKAVGSAMEGGSVFREVSPMVLDEEGEPRDAWFLVTASQFEHEGKPLALVVLEDLTELYELRQIVPLCMGCRKVRDDAQFWRQVDEYLSKHAGLRFSPGLCPECLAQSLAAVADRFPEGEVPPPTR